MTQEKPRDGYIPLPNSDKHNCFGCSPKNDKGLKMKFYTNKDVDVVVSWFSVPPNYCGWGPIVHGGIISTMLDEAMGWGALVILGKLVLSKSISVEFLSPVIAGKEIRVEGGVREVIGERKGVLQGFIYSDNDVLCARATSDVSLFTMDYIRKMGALDEAMLGDLETLVNFRERVGE
ncbi:MAG: PaaI family thioesterase [Deltaproteobacteria bacterium]|nr:PaaI family thioesterase [Candidatus Zymogenaceae bacterium]